MVKESIQIFLRIRPNSNKFQGGEYEIFNDTEGDRVSVKVPTELESSNRKDNFNFKFCRVFDQDCRQEAVFEAVAKPTIDNFLKGYNGTIFAYGQTGSGKTFTITGGAEKYADRGIIPRTLSYIFDHINKDKSHHCSLEISYLEIYNENGYDLLDTKHDSAQKLEDLSKVTLYEDQDANVTLKNMSIHATVNEEEALNLLFVGDTNRMVAETPMNQASTRSHCIFTVHLTARQPESAIVTKSKLHLVDLAGSERVYKTQVDGTLLTEAKYINLSLHYLEQVIVALAEKKRSHIPYRNSMMTSVLRDSLGGNCRTSMIATISLERRNIMESIATCRFSQRVALIKNEAVLNEDLDPQVIIKQLRLQVDDLRAQMQLTGTTDSDWDSGQLSDEILRRCRIQVLEFLEDPSSEIPQDILRDVRKIHIAFNTMRELYARAKSLGQEAREDQRHVLPAIVVPDNPIATKEVSQLREIVAQRDSEINILVSLLKKAKEDVASQSSRHFEPHSSEQTSLAKTFIKSSADLVAASNGHCNHSREVQYSPDVSHEPFLSSVKTTVDVDKRILGDLSVGREEAFELFKRDHSLQPRLREHKDELKVKYAEAKELGHLIKTSRDKSNRIKAEIGRVRIRQAITGDPKSASPGSMPHVRLASVGDEEERLRAQLDQEAADYKRAYLRLRELKTVIEHLQHLLDTAKVTMAKDFESWWQQQVERIQKEKQNNTSTGANSNYSDVKGPPTRYPMLPASSMRGRHSNTSLPPSTASSASGRPHIPLTGDAKVDADIQRFIEARNRLRN